MQRHLLIEVETSILFIIYKLIKLLALTLEVVINDLLPQRIQHQF
jgi:hypothetical protein